MPIYGRNQFFIGFPFQAHAPLLYMAIYKNKDHSPAYLQEQEQRGSDRRRSTQLPRIMAAETGGAGRRTATSSESMRTPAKRLVQARPAGSTAWPTDLVARYDP